MYWGNLLLTAWDTFKNKLSDAIADVLYWIVNLLPRMFYAIWRGLAWIVDGIEGIFRNLAGVGDAKTDMVSEIINNKSVQAIFGNLVGLSTALIVFFTIVKIIQDHYKDKDGGNPYKIVVRTFKGLLMFFFVNAAVSVGLYASQVMFKALDAATGSGASSIAGQVFKIMAEPANRRDDAYDTSADEEDGSTSTGNRYWKRVNDQKSTIGSYFMTEVTDNGKGKTQAELEAQYLKAFPVSQYGVVVGDGTKVIPLTQYLGIAGEYGEFEEFGGQLWDNLVDQYGHNYVTNKYESSRIGSSGSAGFKSDFLRGINLTVTPSISLDWSPVDIDDYYFSLGESNKVDDELAISVGFFSSVIKYGYQYLKFDKPVIKTKSLEDTAKKFGISIDGQVSLQGGEACAGFKLENFDRKYFYQILWSILLNVSYTNVLTYLMQKLPAFVGVVNVGPLVFNLVELFGPVVTSCIDAIIEQSYKNLIPEDENGNALVEMFADKAEGYNSGIWCIMNSKAKTFDTVIEQYRIDKNFGDLWSQLDESFKALRSQLESAATDAYKHVEQAAYEMNERSKRIQDQQHWVTYKTLVDKYNDYAASSLTKLGNMLELRDAAITIYGNSISNSHSEYIKSKGYNGSWSKLESDIKSIFVDLVSQYENGIDGQKSANDYADPRICPSIYKPIIEFGFTETFASSLNVEQIKALLTGNQMSGIITNGSSNLNVNLVIDENCALDPDTSGAYRTVDWKAYGPLYTFKTNISATEGGKTLGGELKDVADIYCENQENVEKELFVNNSLPKLSVFNLKQDQNLGWEGLGGIRYFLHNSGADNHFIECSGLDSWTQMCNNSYWGSDGIILNGDSLNPVFYYYEGTTYRPLKGSTYSIASANDVRISSANANIIPTLSSVECNSQTNVTTTETDESLINKFKENIITFRRLTPTEDGGQEQDKKALKEWCKTTNNVTCTGTHTEEMLYNMTATEIDDMMTDGDNSARRYLMQTARSEVGYTEAMDDCANWDSYIGQFSWKDDNTVNALYNWWGMNYIVGFIAIISAVGVYLNFAFGLIQRAVNMAVLFMMSPVSIAFYPFDEGSKFNNAFVKPFYNEAISAFAVIISLNLFVVLFNPLQNAVAAVTNGMFGWLALIAFVSMLPQIRSTVVSILGGGKLAEKSLSDTVKTASGAFSAPFKDIGNLAKGASKKGAEFVRRTRSTVNGTKAMAKPITEKFEADLRQRRANGEDLGFWGNRYLDKKDGVDRKALQQKKIDDAREAYNHATDAESRQNALSGLSKREVKRMENQNKAAMAQAYINTRRGKNESEAEWKGRVAKERDRLLENPEFKKSINGVVANTRARAAEKRKENSATDWIKDEKKAASAQTKLNKQQAKEVNREINKLAFANSWVGKATEKVGQAGQKVGQKVGQGANSAVHFVSSGASMLKFAVDKSMLGTDLKRRYGLLGKKSQNKDSIIGQFINLSNPEIAKQDMEKEIARNVKIEQLMADGKEKASKGMGEAVDNISKADRVVKDTANQMAGGDKNLAKSFEEEIRGLGKEGATVLKQWLEINNAQTRDFNWVKKLGETIKIDKDDKKMATLNDIVKNDTSYEQMIADIKSQFGIKDDEAKGLESKMYKENLENAAGTNREIKLRSAALQSIQFEAEGLKQFRNALGPLADSPDAQRLLDQAKKTYDVDFKSENPESLGYQKQKIIEEYKKRGKKQDDPDCIRDMLKLAKEFNNALDDEFDRFFARHGSEVRAFDIKKKGAEEMHNASVISMAEEMQKAREKFIQSTLDTATIQAVIKDEQIQKLHRAGNFSGAGDRLMQLVDAVRDGNDALIQKLGFGTELVEKLKKWQKNGDTESLQKVYDWGHYDSAHMSNGAVDMGGATLQGAQTVFTALTSIAEMKGLMQRLDALVNSAGHEEADARAYVNNLSDSLSDMFAGTEWNNLAKNIRNASGQLVKSKEEMFEVLRQNLQAVANDASKRDEDLSIKANLQALSAYKTEHHTDQGMVNTIDRYISGIGKAVTADRKSAEVDAARTTKGMYQSEIFDALQKIQKDLSKFTVDK